MKAQECRKNRIYNIGFMDPNVIHEESVRQWPNRTENNIFMALDGNNIFMALDGQHTCTFILLLYNKYISNICSLYVYQQLPLDLTLYRDRSSPGCGLQLFEEAKRKISRSHRHHAKGMGSFHQKTHRSHINAVWSLFQTWLSGTNTYRTSTVISLNTMNIS